MSPADFDPQGSEVMCHPCANGKHAKCKTRAWNPLDGGKHEPCNCPLRSMPEHP